MLKDHARELRKEMTLAERRLWRTLRHDGFGVRFRRQVPIGPYIADFVCFERRLVIELDGSQHLDSQADVVRDAWFAAQGFLTLRFWNQAVMDELPGVVEAILGALARGKEAPPPP